VTSNVEALLAENDALRRELQRTRRELERFRRQQRPRPEPTLNLIRKVQVQRWGEALAQQPGWSELHQVGLEALIKQLNRQAFPANLNLRQRLDRLVAGLGTELLAAVAEPATLPDHAVLAAFALYGVRASEWLDEDPRRVVEDLRQRLQSSRRPVGDPRADALAVLGLDPGASAVAIKRAHRRLVKQHHPDMGGSAEAFRRVNEAYQQLMG
jgi:anti-sigma factor RsiW